MAEERKLAVVDLGRCDYDTAWDVQTAVHATILEDEGEPDRLILVEHPAVITLGRGADPQNVLFNEDYLSSQGVELRRTDRGGDVTYHGPGQIVAYPIVRLMGRRRDVHGYFRSLEQVVIELLAEYRIRAGREDGLTGVWVGDEKVCAMGVAIKRWITYHGLALNVAPNLGHFRLITPCGIADKGVTSMRELLGRSVPMAEVKEKLVRQFAAEFEYQQVEREQIPDGAET